MAAEIKIVISSSAAGTGVQQVAKDIRDLDTAARSSTGGFSVLGGAASAALGGIVASAASAAGSAIVGFVGSSISAASDFEAGMNEFAAAAGGSLEAAGLSVEDFSSLFLEMGQKLPVSTAEVQEAAVALIKGGLDPAVIAAGGLESSLNFASAAGMGLAEAAEVGVKMLGTFVPITASAAEKTEFLASSQDLLVKAANASTLNVDALSDAMLAAGGQANAAGLDYEDFVTTMGLISPAFGSAAEAGTSFKNMLVRLQPSTVPAKEAMYELGLITEAGNNVFYDAQGNFLGMENAAQQLQTAFSGLTEQQRLQSMQLIFGNDAMGAANALANGGAEAYQAFAAQMANANGVSEQAAAVQQGLGFQMENFKGSVEALQITIGTALLPVLTALFATVLTPAIGTLMTLTQAATGNATAFASLSPPLQTMLTIGQQIAAFVTANLQPILAALGGVITALLAPAIASGVAALAAFVVAFAPVLAVVAVAMAVGAALAGAWSANFMNIQGLVTTAMNAVNAVITGVLDQVLAFWAANGEEIMAFTAQAWAQIQQIIGTVAAIIATIVTNIFGAIAGFIAAHGEDIQTVLTAAWSVIQTFISSTLDNIQGVVNAVLALLQGDWQTAWEEIKAIVERSITAAQEIITTVTEAIKDIWARNGDAIKAKAEEIWNGILDAIEGLAGRAMSAGKAFIDNIKEGIMGAIDKLLADARAKLQELADMLPGSEPKDTSSPLYGLGKRGAAIVGNLQQGLMNGPILDLAPALAPAVAQIDRVGGGGRTSSATYNRAVSITQNFHNRTKADYTDTAVLKALATRI